MDLMEKTASDCLGVLCSDANSDERSELVEFICKEAGLCRDLVLVEMQHQIIQVAATLRDMQDRHV